MTANTMGSEALAGTPDATTKIAVWDLPTRIFHWTLAASFTGAFLTAESERWRDLHVMLGYTLLGLIAFRLIWGFIGSRYARFSSFTAGPSRLAAYAKSLLSGQPQHHVGHNPAGALAIFLLLSLGLVVGLSGWASFNEIGGDWLEELHEGAANAMLAVVVIHLLGVVVSSLLHRENLVVAMITGNKAGRAEEGIKARHRLLGIVLLLAVLGFWGAWSSNGNTPQGAIGAGTGVVAPWSDKGVVVAGKSAREAGRHDRDD
jgi:cytochrome b